MKFICGLLFSFVLIACNNDPERNGNNPVATIAPPVKLSYSLLKVYPHDTTAFTQGLQFVQGYLYEGTGNPDRKPGYSKLRKVEYATGKILKEYAIPGAVFGEGITILGDKIYQITYQEKRGFVYHLSDFKLLKEFAFNTEGWGLTNDGTHLIMSDGSSNLFYWDPVSFKEVKRLSVQDNNGLRNNINELEFINGFIYSNVWQKDEILKIDPATGNVVGIIDMSELKKMYPELAGDDDSDKVLNGIAWDSSSNHLFITGKNWSKLFEIKLN